MSYGGSSGGGGSIHASTDVALNNPSDTQVLGYSASLAKWQNQTVVTNQIVLNVLDYGAVGDGVTDDATAIQTALNACPHGGQVFIPRTAGGFLVGSTLVIPSSVSLRGPNGRASSNYPSGFNKAGIIKAKNGSNLDAVIASTAWYNNSGGIDGFITIADLVIDPNGANQTAGLGHGIALSTWRGGVAHCMVMNGLGASIYLGTVTQNGSTAAGNAVENQIVDTILYPTTGGIVTNGSLTTDSWIKDNAIIGTSAGTTTGIRLGGNGGAGSLITGNHIYSCANQIAAGNISLVTINDNYLEPSNAAASSGTVYAITANPVGSSISICGNKIRLPTSAQSGTTYIGIRLFWVASAGAITVSNNTLAGGTSASDRLITASVQTGPGSITLSGNSYAPSGGALSFVNSTPGSLAVDSSPTFQVGVSTGATSGFARLPSVAGTPTATPADLTQGVPLIVDSSGNRLWFFTGGVWRSTSSDTAVAALSNKRVTARVLSLAGNAAMPTINTDLADVVRITGQSTAITSFSTNLTGTPVDGDGLKIAITATSTIAIAWGAAFESSTVTLPTSTVATNRLDVWFIWNSDTQAWRCRAVA